MELKQKIELKPETKQLLKLAAIVLVISYVVSMLLYHTAGVAVDYQLAMALSERLAMGIRTGFGLLCIGFLILECK